MISVAIIGAGLIGKKRANTLPKGVRLTTICDIDENKALDFAKEFNCIAETNWKEVIKDTQVDAIILCTINKFLAPITKAAILNGKHVLVEKPGAKNIREIKLIKKVYKKQCVLMYGYNHRLHPAFIMAKKIVDSKKYGTLLFIRAKYGHGGRIGYEKEWRFNEDLAGGGELLDQGVHLIDLVNHLAGEMNKVVGLTGQLFWKSSLEDSVFFILRNQQGAVAHLSATCVEWKNLFQFEIMLKTAKIQIDGLGSSYGREKLTLYKMKPKMGPPDLQEFLFDEKDNSWEIETKEFFDKIKKKEYSDQAINDAIYVLNIVDKLYKINL